MGRINPELINKFLNKYKKPEDVINDYSIFEQLEKALIERLIELESKCNSGYKIVIKKKKLNGK